jgi:NAD(P)-dependent dehydrogenase (short-subunit alcohol dehydrogenase family)
MSQGRSGVGVPLAALTGQRRLYHTIRPGKLGLGSGLHAHLCRMAALSVADCSTPRVRLLVRPVTSAVSAQEAAMSTPEDHSSTSAAPRQREPELAGQTVVLIGGSAGIGLETARRARAEGAEVVLTGRNPDRLSQAADEVGASRTATFDATDAAALAEFFTGLDAPIDHVLVTAGGPVYGPLLEMDSAQVRDALSDHVVVGLEVARNAVGKMRPGGTLLLMGGTGGRRITRGLGIAAAATAALPPFAAALALEVAPVRVNLIAAGFVDTPLSASLLGDQLDERRRELRDTLPIGRVVTPADVAALAVHLMANTAVTGATYDIDGGQQFV